MGVVYKARYVVNGRLVALKMLPPDVTDSTTLARFEREVEVLKNLKHANIVRCFGGTCEDKRRFYAMELIEGGNLEEKLQAKGNLPWEQVIEYGLQICAGLQCLHEQGVVHRDIKPSNFLLTRQGQLKLSDFGLASVAASRKITAAGKTAGTFLYMAPEQIRGKTVTSRTDLYALGCVLYELLSGVPPFIGETPAATLHLHCNHPTPRITEKVLDCPIALERILLKLLSKSPEDRYETAKDVAKDLQGVSQTVSATGRDLVKTAIKLGDSGPQRKIGAVPIDESVSPQLQSNWIPVAALACALVVSLGINLSLNSQVKVGKNWEELWIKAANSSDEALKLQAVYALGELSAASNTATDRLALGLHDPNPGIRVAALKGLAKSSTNGRKHLPEMVKTVKLEADSEVRMAADAAIAAVERSPSSNWLPPFWLILWTLVGAAAGAVAYWWNLRKKSEPAPASTREIASLKFAPSRPY